jgi:hypothetical protein
MEINDIVYLIPWDRDVTITCLHSGHYDFQYTGVDEDGQIIYFNDEDAISEER